MSKDIKEKLWDGSYRVMSLGRHDGEFFPLPNPIEYAAKCLRLATHKKSDNWRDTADSWLITINNQAFEYYTGVGHRKQDKPVTPELSAVLSCLVLDAAAASESFEDWCSELGYDSDSRKALETYLECQNTALEMRKAKIYLNDDLREFLQQY